MIESFLDGLFLVFEWPAPGFLVLGVLLGLWLGAVPGLGGIIGLVLLLPFTFDMGPVPAIALLLGMYSVTTTSDTIASVMLGIPGTAASQATILDGHPLATQGQAARAFGAAFTVSAFGGVFGAVALMVSLPLVLPIILAFSKAELFMLAVLGLTMVGSLAGQSVFKGLTVALFGLLVATVGYGETTPVPRFDFGFNYLLDGLPIIPIVLGLFGVPEIIELAVGNTSISRHADRQSTGGGMRDGIRDACRNWWLATRCSAIGTYVGVIPGLGPAIVDWIAYGHAVQSARDKSKFGHGDIRGVIAPESANNATKGGSLIPAVAFGIPGSLGAAILLEALMIQGYQPGPAMLTTDLHITSSLIWTIVVANILGAVLLMMWSKQVSRLAFVPGHLIVPGVMFFVLMGSWLANVSLGDWIVTIVFSFVGYVMKRGGWPRPPFVLALILGPIMEQTFQISMAAHRGASWLWERPVVLGIAALCVLTVVLSARGVIRAKRAGDDAPTLGEGSEINPILSFPFALFLLMLFAYAFVEARGWPTNARQFPVTIAVPGVLFALYTVFRDGRALAARRRIEGSLTAIWQIAAKKHALKSTAMFFGYLIGVCVLSLVIGQKLAIPIYLFVYLVRWGKYGPGFSAAYAAVGWAVLVFFYDRVLHIFWQPTWLADWLTPLLPGFVPSWWLF